LSLGVAGVLVVQRFCKLVETSKIDLDVSLGLALVAYAMPFACAYYSTISGVGALILFLTALFTLVVCGLYSKDADEVPTRPQWAGIAIAIAALVFMIVSGLSDAPGSGEAIMMLAGVCWGYYVARGRNKQPAASTLGNFVIATTVAFPIWIVYLIRAPSFLPDPSIDRHGFLAASASGFLCSGIAYVAWYYVVKKVPYITSGAIQLCVPILVSIFAWPSLGEVPEPSQFVCGSVALLGALIYFWYSPKNTPYRIWLRRALLRYFSVGQRR
jgi:drug/metabolite transporter (DMT)-like permease